MLAPVSFPQVWELYQQPMGGLSFQILHRTGYRQVWRYPYQHVNMVSVDGSGIDIHLLAERDFSQELATTQSKLPHKNLVSILGRPDHVILTIPHRMTATLVITHVTYYTDPSPKGEGFTDPLSGTLTPSCSGSISALSQVSLFSGLF